MFKATISILLLILSYSAHSQNKIYTFPEIGWTINIPADVGFKDTSLILEDGINRSLEIYGQKNISAIFSVIRFNHNQDSNYQDLKKNLRYLMYLTHLPEINKSKIDTATSNEIIGGIRFEKFHAILSADKDYTSTILLYSQLYEGYVLTVELFYPDEKTGKQFLKMATRSKFKKRK